MTIARKWFINNTPLILFTPFSLVVGLWIFQQIDLLTLEDNRPFLYFYLFFTLLPLVFLFVRSNQKLGHEIVEVMEKFTVRFLERKWVYLAISIAFSIFYLYIASIHISTYDERDRWILTNDLPILPIDMVIPSRLALVTSWFVPIDIAVPLVNLLIILIWFAFLIYINSGEGNSWDIVFLIFISTFFTGLFYTTLYATFEFPSTMFSFIGLYGIWRRKFNVGLTFLVIGSVFKNTGIFQLATGGVMFLFICWQEKSIKSVIEKLDLALTVFLGIYFIVNHWGHFYYIFILKGGPQYLVEPNVNNVVWFSAFATFVKSIFSQYRILFVLGLIGIIFIKEKRLFALLTLGVLIFLRSFSKWADGGYATIFIPALSFFSVFGLAYLWKFLKPIKLAWLLITCLIIGNIYVAYGLFQNFPYGMNKINSNFDGFVRKLAWRFPEVGRIYQKDISLKPYLQNKRGNDLDGIEFKIYPEEEVELISELSHPGCKLIIAVKSDLEKIGVVEEDLLAIGYSEGPYTLEDKSETWIAYSKECNAWEYD